VIKSWETLAKCSDCGAEKIKRKDELCENYRCIKCFRKHRGSLLGNTFGKAQQKQGKCKNCSAAIPSTLKYCKDLDCQKAKEIAMSDRMTGANNPVWTGNQLCKCGNKKNVYAKRCRDCSFRSGNRSGSNNGRYISENRDEFLANQRSRKVARNILSNYIKAQGLKKKYKTEVTLGYSFQEFRSHIDLQLEDWMSWDNYGLGEGKWNVDHIVPISVLNDMGITSPKQVNALCNLRPMCSIRNIQKSNSLEDDWESVVAKIKTIET
jgi:hypothetical protein